VEKLITDVLHPRERILKAETGVKMVFRGRITLSPSGSPEISTKLEGWTVKKGALVLTDRRMIFATGGRKYLFLKVPNVLLDAPTSKIRSVGVAEGRVRELVISIETGRWRKDKFYFNVENPEEWAKIVAETVSRHKGQDS